MGNDMITNATEIGKNLTSALDKFMGMMKNRSDYNYEEKQKRLELEDLKARIEVVKNSDVPMELNKDGTTIYSPMAIDLMNRAGQRLAFQELKKQMNIENTLYETKKILEKEKENGQDAASNELVKEDFMTQFYNGVGEISDEEMQRIWAKILTGEIKTPGKFSLRTLQKLKTISTSEAILFEKIAPFVIDFTYIPDDDEMLKSYGITIDDLLLLEDCEIMSLKSFNKVRYVNRLDMMSMYNKNLICNFDCKGLDSQIIKIVDSGYNFTQFGKELLEVIQFESNDKFFVEYITKIKNKYIGLNVSFHDIKNKNGNNVEYYMNKKSLNF